MIKDVNDYVNSDERRQDNGGGRDGGGLTVGD